MNPKPEHEHLSAWLDGELSDAEIADLEAELARDPSLRAELDALEGVVSFVRQEGPAQAPMGFHHRVMAKIDEEFPERTSAWSWLRRPWGIPLEGWVLAAAAAAVLLMLVPDWGLQPGPEPTPGEEKELSPAAIEMPAPIAEKDLPNLEKPPVVLGKATTANGKPTKGIPTKGGTEKVALPAEALKVVEPEKVELPGTSEETKPAPSPTLEIPAAPEASVRYVIESDDPKMKREVLNLAAEYGGARDLQNQKIESALMGSNIEELLVSIKPTQLIEFTNELRKLGYDVERDSEEKMVPGGKIDVRLTLSLSEPDAEEAAHPAPLEADMPSGME